MYRPSQYNNHDSAMLRYAKLFNECQVHKEIQMIPNDSETFTNDGYIVNIENNRKLGFDWERRDRYFEYCKFAFRTLGQFERKLKKDCIEVSIQCDSTETGVIIAWHKDWLEGERIPVKMKTDFSFKENGYRRDTDKFKIYSYNQIEQAKNMFARALAYNDFTHKVFEEE